MSTRSYSNLIVLETIFDSIPSGKPELDSFVLNVFSPFVHVVEQDCGTSLGTPTAVNYELEGKVELATSTLVSFDRIISLLSNGVYTTPVRSLSSCISKDGVCQTCYHASRQKDTIPAIGSHVQVMPEYVTATEALTAVAGQSSFTISETPDLYDLVYVYHLGVLLTSSQYTIDNLTLTLASPVTSDGQVTVRYTTYIRAPYLFWLAGTYSGSMLGIKQLPAPPIPLRKRLLTSLIPESVLELLVQGVSTLRGVPVEAIDYMSKVHDPLEKALLVIAIYAIYLNVS